MSILDHLPKPAAEPAAKDGDFMTAAVFECALYRMGYDPKDWMDEAPEDREFILNYLENKKNEILPISE